MFSFSWPLSRCESNELGLNPNGIVLGHGQLNVAVTTKPLNAKSLSESPLEDRGRTYACGVSQICGYLNDFYKAPDSQFWKRFFHLTAEVSDRRRAGRWSARSTLGLEPGVERESGAAVRSTDFVRPHANYVSPNYHTEFNAQTDNPIKEANANGTPQSQNSEAGPPCCR